MFKNILRTFEAEILQPKNQTFNFYFKKNSVYIADSYLWVT